MDEQSFELLYNRYFKLVYSVALRILRNIASAEEVTHEVFLHLWRNIHLYDSSRGSMFAWLVAITRNKALDRFRLKGECQRRNETHDADSNPDSTPGLDTTSNACSYEFELDDSRRMERVREFIAGMSLSQRSAIELAFFEELSHQEIAVRLDAPLGTVKSWIRNGLLSLRLHLNAAPLLPFKLPVSKAPAVGIVALAPTA